MSLVNNTTNSFPHFLGMPWHGVLKATAVFGTHAIYDYAGNMLHSLPPGYPTVVSTRRGGYTVVIHNDRIPLLTRTPAEITADSALNMEYRDYALCPQGWLYGLHTGVDNTTFFFDAKGFTWSVLIEGATNQSSGGILDLTVTFTPIYWVTKRAVPSPVIVAVNGINLGFPVDGTNYLIPALVVDQTKNGGRVLLNVNHGAGLLFAVVELSLSDTINESLGGYPFDGGTVGFTVSAAVLKNFVACVGTATESEVSNGTIYYYSNTGEWIEGYGGPSYIHSGTGNSSATATWNNKLIKACYDNANPQTIVYFTLDQSYAVDSAWLLTPPGEYTHNATGQESFTIKRNNVSVETRSRSSSDSYSANGNPGTLFGYTWSGSVTVDGYNSTDSQSGATPMEIALNGGTGDFRVCEILGYYFQGTCRRIVDDGAGFLLNVSNSGRLGPSNNSVMAQFHWGTPFVYFGGPRTFFDTLPSYKIDFFGSPQGVRANKYLGITATLAHSDPTFYTGAGAHAGVLETVDHTHLRAVSFQSAYVAGLPERTDPFPLGETDYPGWLLFDGVLTSVGTWVLYQPVLNEWYVPAFNGGIEFPRYFNEVLI